MDQGLYLCSSQRLARSLPFLTKKLLSNLQLHATFPERDMLIHITGCWCYKTWCLSDSPSPFWIFSHMVIWKASIQHVKSWKGSTANKCAAQVNYRNHHPALDHHKPGIDAIIRLYLQCSRKTFNLWCISDVYFHISYLEIQEAQTKGSCWLYRRFRIWYYLAQFLSCGRCWYITSLDAVQSGINAIAAGRRSNNCQRAHTRAFVGIPLIYQSTHFFNKPLSHLRSQAHIMLLKEDQVSPGLAKILGADVIDQLVRRVKDTFDIKEEEFPSQVEAQLKKIIKVGYPPVKYMLIDIDNVLVRNSSTKIWAQDLQETK